VLERELGALDLASVGVARSCQVSSEHWARPVAPERVALRDQPARGFHHRAFASVGGRLGVDELVAMALLGKARARS